MVEDSEDDSLLILRILQKSGYDPVYKRVETAEAMQAALREQSWEIILCDYNFPHFNGLKAIELLAETGIDIPLIIISGRIGEETAVAAMKAGAHDYVMKDNLSRLVPAIEREMKEAIVRRKKSEAEERYRHIVENALEGIFQSTPEGRYISTNRANAVMMGYDSPEEMMTEVTDISRQIYVDPEDRETIRRMLDSQDAVRGFEAQCYRKDGSLIWLSLNMRAVRDPGGRLLYYEGFSADITGMKESFERIRKALGATVRAMAMTVEARDPYTAGHQRRVADLARAIATEMGLTPHQIDGIRLASTIHDIGKISVPAEILSKPTKLTELEFALIKVHPDAGFDILKDIDFPWPIARMVHEHHERMNGSGYPCGLKGNELLPESRVIMVADVVEAIASHRPYRPALGIEAALEEIINKKGPLYEAAPVDACVAVFRDKGYQFE
jgi:PAS domain S-box-containing protein